MGSSITDEIALIPSGKLFLTRSPNSPKGSLECLYNDAYASIKQTSRPFIYQLSVSKVYQEGEADGDGSNGFGFDDSDEDDDDHHLDTSNSMELSSKSKDEWNFLIVPDLHFEISESYDGSNIKWIDLNGDYGDKFEFTIDEDVKLKDFIQFKTALFKCLYELKYHTSADNIEANDLKEFEKVQDPELTIDDFKNDLLGYHKHINDSEINGVESKTPNYKTIPKPVLQQPQDSSTFVKSHTSSDSDFGQYDSKIATKFRDDIDINSDDIIFETPDISLFLFNSITTKFDLIDKVELKLINRTKWNYSLILIGKVVKFETRINSNMNPTFNFEFLSFVFNYFKLNIDNKSLDANSFLIKFNNQEALMSFKNYFIKLMWQVTNKKNFDNENNENEYMNDMILNNSLAESEVDRMDDGIEEDQWQSDSDSSESTGEDNEYSKRRTKLIYESSEPMPKMTPSSTESNSLMALGYGNNRSYVVRGNNLGVFKNTDDDVEFETNINNITNKLGDLVIPDKVMLQNQDQNMVFKGKDNNQLLYRMDLNRGQIVEQWEINNKDGRIEEFGPNKKLDQLTNDPTFIGLSANSMYHLDSRLKDVVVNDKTFKQYKTRNNKFSNLITTEDGKLAVGSGNGAIRLYENVGGNAKTLIPSLGDPIIGLDVSMEGRWLLATCKNYLLLIDTKISDGEKLGYTTSFPKDKKPVPKKLVLRPQHALMILKSTQSDSLNFTKAFFNTGLHSKETNIVTSSANFLISWSLKKILKNEEPNYLIKKYDEPIVSNNFEFESNSNIIFALENDVSKISSNKFSKT